MIFETHAHYDNPAFDEDRNKLLEELPKRGIKAVVNVGADLASTRRTLDLVKAYPHVYGSVGVHPSECKDLSEEDMLWLKQQTGAEKIIAVGEIGLDYYWEGVDHQIQKKWFVRQLWMARETGLPVIIHSRDAAKDTLDIMKGERAGEMGGVIHCFSYSREMAKEYLEMGFYLGIGGVLTFQNAKRLKEVVEYAPMDSLVLETDSPYLAPSPHRGERNSSLYLPLVVEALASLKGISPEEVEERTWENARRLYRLS